MFWNRDILCRNPANSTDRHRHFMAGFQPSIRVRLFTWALRPRLVCLSSSRTSFTPCYQDILYTLGRFAQRSTAVDRWATRSISRTRVLQK